MKSTIKSAQFARLRPQSSWFATALLLLASLGPRTGLSTEFFSSSPSDDVSAPDGHSLRNTLELSGPNDHVWLDMDPFATELVPDGIRNRDLLKRLRQGFRLNTPLTDRTKQELKWFASHPEYLDRVLIRGQRYLPHIVAELDARGLPLELALLPIVESAFDPFAYSHGRAAGLWQIIPGTGKRFGIEQNWWYDGRRDPVDSTNGALDYLAYLHNLMDGDWLLAIASYNSGEGNVRKAVRRNRSREKPTDFWNLSLSRETSAYVPRLMALVEIVRDPAAYDLVLPEIVDAPQFTIVDIGAQLDLALAAELAGTDTDTLYALNAGNNRWATDPAGPHRLLVPVAAAEQFETALAKVPENERIRWQRHKIENGEAISQIAQRYGTTVSAIKQANKLSGTTIRAASHLMIPMASKPLSEYNQTSDARRARKQNAERSGTRVEHVVAAGESFWTISRRYNVNINKLAAWNGTAPRDTLSVGQKLVVWTQEAAAPVTSVVNGTTRKLRYTVRRGDSLSLIASRFRTTVSDIVKWNKIDEGKILRPGQKLTMFVDVTAQSS